MIVRKPLLAEVRHEGGYWSVFVNGQRTVDRESFAVADRIRECLEYPGLHWQSEAAEVADTIRKHFEQATEATM